MCKEGGDIQPYPGCSAKCPMSHWERRRQSRYWVETVVSVHSLTTYEIWSRIFYWIFLFLKLKQLFLCVDYFALPLWPCAPWASSWNNLCFLWLEQHELSASLAVINVYCYCYLLFLFLPLSVSMSSVLEQLPSSTYQFFSLPYMVKGGSAHIYWIFTIC